MLCTSTFTLSMNKLWRNKRRHNYDIPLIANVHFPDRIGQAQASVLGQLSIVALQFRYLYTLTLAEKQAAQQAFLCPVFCNRFPDGLKKEFELLGMELEVASAGKFIDPCAARLARSWCDGNSYDYTQRALVALGVLTSTGGWLWALLWSPHARKTKADRGRLIAPPPAPTVSDSALVYSVDEQVKAITKRREEIEQKLRTDGYESLACKDKKKKQQMHKKRALRRS